MVLGGRYAVHVSCMEWRTSGRFYEGAAGTYAGNGGIAESHAAGIGADALDGDICQ